MPDPTINNPVIVPINANNYVSNIETNFSRLQANLSNIYSQVATATNGAGTSDMTGVLEVNGHFNIVRWLDEFATSTPVTGDDEAATGTYADLPTGSGLGFSGTTYTYHPSRACGWFIAQELLTGGFGTHAPDGIVLDIDAGTRTEDLGNDDWPAFYQPCAHLRPDLFAGRTVTAVIKYDTTRTTGFMGRLYIAWSGPSGRGFTEVPLAHGLSRVLSVTATPPSNATHLEFGVVFDDPLAFEVKIEFCILTNSPGRTQQLVRKPIPLAVDRTMVELWYSVSGSGVTCGGAATASPVYSGGTSMTQTLPTAGRINDPASAGQFQWPNASMYSVDAFVSVAASPVQWERTTDNVVVNMIQATIPSMSGIDQDLSQYSINLVYDMNTLGIRSYVPHPFTSFVYEVNAMYPPLFA